MFFIYFKSFNRWIKAKIKCAYEQISDVTMQKLRREIYAILKFVSNFDVFAFSNLMRYLIFLASIRLSLFMKLF